MSRFVKENIWSATMLQRGYSRASSQKAFFQHLRTQGHFQGPGHAGLPPGLKGTRGHLQDLRARGATYRAQGLILPSIAASISFIIGACGYRRARIHHCTVLVLF